MGLSRALSGVRAAVNEDRTDERTLSLVVLELTDTYVVVSGAGGGTVLPGDILAGERRPTAG